MKQHHAIAKQAVKAGQWAASVDGFAQFLDNPENTLEVFLQMEKNSKHYDVFLRRYAAMPRP